MGELRNYRVLLNGTETTMQLSEAHAAAMGGVPVTPTTPPASPAPATPPMPTTSTVTVTATDDPVDPADDDELDGKARDVPNKVRRPKDKDGG